MIIGIGGTDGAGKGAITEYLVNQKKFSHFSSRAAIIEEIERRGLPVDREAMRLVANDMRREKGNDVMVTTALSKMKESVVTDAVIESIRTTAEVETLKQNGGVLLIVDADQKLRYKRIQERKSPSDQVTYEAFVAHEELEMNDPDPHGMQKAKVIEMADYTIMNDGTLEELHTKIDEILSELE